VHDLKTEKKRLRALDAASWLSIHLSFFQRLRLASIHLPLAFILFFFFEQRHWLLFRVETSRT
jgi:hypothetical protein